MKITDRARVKICIMMLFSSANLSHPLVSGTNLELNKKTQVDESSQRDAPLNWANFDCCTAAQSFLHVFVEFLIKGNV